MKKVPLGEYDDNYSLKILIVEGDLVAGGGFVHGLAAESARFSGETIKNVFTNIS